MRANQKLALLGSVLSLVASAQAANRYVATYGNDANNGLATNAANAWATLAASIPKLSAGDTLWVLPGTYGEGDLPQPPSGTSYPNGMTTIRNYDTRPIIRPAAGAHKANAWTDAHFIMLNGLRMDCTLMTEPNAEAGSKWTWSTHNVLTNMEIWGANNNDMHGLHWSNGSDETKQSGSNLTVNCWIHNFGDGTQQGQNNIYNQVSSNLFIGVLSSGANNFGAKVGAVDTVGTVFRECTFTANGEGGLEFDQCGNTWAINCQAHANKSYGFKMGYRAAEFGPMYWLHDLAYGQTNGLGFYIQLSSSGSSNIYVINCASVTNRNIPPQLESGGFVFDDVPATIYASNNLAYGNSVANYVNYNGSGTIESGNLFGNQYDAAFVDAANTNFAIGASSGARNAGVATSVTVDLIGTSRPQETAPDIGPYEYTSGGQLPTVSVNATDDTATELDATTGTFTFTRTGSTSGALTVNFVLTGSTASSGTDYTSIGTSVIIADGQATATKTVTPIDDTDPEADETVKVTVSADAAYTVGTPDNATVTIRDNDSQSQQGALTQRNIPPRGQNAILD